jgi:hypothetical protein
MSSIRTRSGRISKPPERLEIIEDVEDDFTDEEDEDFVEDDYDSESETESELDDDDEDADENGNLAGFVVDDDEESEIEE